MKTIEAQAQQEAYMTRLCTATTETEVVKSTSPVAAMILPSSAHRFLSYSLLKDPFVYASNSSLVSEESGRVYRKVSFR